MAEDSSSSTASVAIVILVIALLVFLYFMFIRGGDDDANIEVELPEVEVQGSVDAAPLGTLPSFG